MDNIAPIVLFVLYLVLWLSIIILSFFKSSIGGIYLDFSFRTILALLGSFVGLFLAKKSDKKKLANLIWLNEIMLQN